MLANQYMREKRNKRIWIVGAALLLLFLMLIGASIGLPCSYWQPVGAIRDYVMGTLPFSDNREISAIILTIRLPRVLLAVLSGFALAVSGTVMQSITRNALVSPFTVGISSAAALGASIGIVLGISNISWVVALAFFAAVCCMSLLYGISTRIGITPGSIILVGISLNYLFGAFTELIRFFAKGYQLESLVQWSFGTLNRADWQSVVASWIVIGVGISFLYQKAMELDAVAYNGDEVVRSLGISCGKLRMMTGCMAVLMTATVICFTGVIGFVGLVAPHMARILIGGEHRYTLPFSGFLGAILMLVADAIGHYIYPPNDIPVSIILSFIGVPLFIHLILHARKES